VPKLAPKTPAPANQLAVNLIALRSTGNWSTRALAEQAHVDRRTVQHLEKGHSNVSLRTVDKLARALGVQTGSLFGKTPLPRNEGDRLLEAVLAQNLVQARTVLRLTQESLGAQSGVSMYVIAHIERRSRNPTLQTLEKLSVPLGLSLETLLTEPHNPHI
jgi:transcriptional regulator with XRE-family HTH domain